MADATLKSQALDAAKAIEQEFIAALKGQIPTPEESALLVKATRTLAAAPLLGVASPAVREEVAHAKAILGNLAVAHLIDSQEAYAVAVNAALDKFATIALGLLLKL